MNENVSAILLNSTGTLDIHVSYTKPKAAVEPVSENTEAVPEAPEPATEAAETTEAVPEAVEPVAEATEPAAETTEPAAETTETTVAPETNLSGDSELEELVENFPDVSAYFVSIPISDFVDISDQATELPTMTVEAVGPEGDKITLTIAVSLPSLFFPFPF